MESFCIRLEARDPVQARFRAYLIAAGTDVLGDRVLGWRRAVVMTSLPPIRAQIASSHERAALLSRAESVQPKFAQDLRPTRRRPGFHADGDDRQEDRETAQPKRR